MINILKYDTDCFFLEVRPLDPRRTVINQNNLLFFFGVKAKINNNKILQTLNYDKESIIHITGK